MIEERIEQLQSELGKVQAELDELKAQLKPKPEDRFGPKVGEEYWFVNDRGNTERTNWNDDDEDNYRLAVGNVHRTKEDARRHKASLFLKTPTGPCPKVGEVLERCSVLRNRIDNCNPSYIGAMWLWNAGEACVMGYEAELEAKWKRYGWSVTGEPEPEGWES